MKSIFKNPYVRGLVVSAITFTLISWFRVFISGTVKVDGFGLSGVPVYIVFLSFIGALIAYTWSLYRLWDSQSISAKQVCTLSIALTAVFSLMLPMMSNDIYSLLCYGDAANKGVDVYTDPDMLHVSSYYDYVSDLWKKAPCVYGPVTLTISRIACFAAHGNIYIALAVYKVINYLWAALFILMAYLTAQRLSVSIRPLIFIVLNPIFLLQGVAQLHCDIIAVSFCAAAVYFFFTERWYMAFAFIGLAVGAKMNFILILGFLGLAQLFRGERWHTVLVKQISGVAITLTVLFILYYPYYTSIATFKTPMAFLFGQNPAKSLAEVFGDIIYFAPSVISGHNAELNSAISRSSGVSDPQLGTWLVVKHICQAFAALVAILVSFMFLSGQLTMARWMQVFLRFLLIFLLFYSHVFYAWYLMIILPFVWFEDDRRFIQWLFVLTSFVNVHDIMCAVNHDTPVYFAVLPLTLFSVLVFFWRFRSNFYRTLRVSAPIS